MVVTALLRQSIRDDDEFTGGQPQSENLGRSDASPSPAGPHETGMATKHPPPRIDDSALGRYAGRKSREVRIGVAHQDGVSAGYCFVKCFADIQ